MTDKELAERFGVHIQRELSILDVWREKLDARHIWPRLAAELEAEAYLFTRAAGHYGRRALGDVVVLSFDDVVALDDDAGRS